MHDSFITYVVALAVVLAAVFAIKKVAGCMLKTVVFIISLAIVAVLAYFVFAGK